MVIIYPLQDAASDHIRIVLMCVESGLVVEDKSHNIQHRSSNNAGHLAVGHVVRLVVARKSSLKRSMGFVLRHDDPRMFVGSASFKLADDEKAVLDCLLFLSRVLARFVKLHFDVLAGGDVVDKILAPLIGGRSRNYLHLRFVGK